MSIRMPNLSKLESDYTVLFTDENGDVHSNTISPAMKRFLRIGIEKRLPHTLDKTNVNKNASY